MANQVRHYDTAAIRRAATDIRAKLRDYQSASNSIDTTINGMNTYWDDQNNRDFASRYNRELKKTAQSVYNLMEEYAKFLDATADAYDKMIANANSGINGN